MFNQLKKRGNILTGHNRKEQINNRRKYLLRQRQQIILQQEKLQQEKLQQQNFYTFELENLKNFKNYISKINSLYKNYNYIHNENDLKSIHRFNCYKFTKIIRNIIIKDFGDTKNLKETLLIEFRPLPNLEFLIRNTIIKLPNWNHTVICGNNNYEFIKKICDFICKDSESKINIIKLDI